MHLVDPHTDISTFTTAERSRLVAYRAAVAAGLYSDWDGSAARTDTQVLAGLVRAAQGLSAEEPPEARLHPRRLLRRALPLLVDVLRRIEPRALLRLERHVRPGLMGMAGEEQTVAHAESRVMVRQAHRAGLISSWRGWGPAAS